MNRNIAIMLVVATLICIALLAAFALHARAHGDAAWIQAAYPQCCGIQDCREVSAREVVEIGGYLVGPGFHWATNRQAFPSINANYWICQLPDGAARCFFAPVQGS